jgi:ABC-type multidrug transport system fused ATPase/permease subunit
MNYPEDALIECAYCAVRSPAGEIECPACGAPLEEGHPTSEPEEISLEELIENSNQTLVKSGTGAAELAFGVSCTLGLLIGVFLLAIIFIFFTRVWTILAVITFILAMISILVSSLLSTRANAATTGSTFEREVKPEIENYITPHGISHEEFNTKAAEVLPGNSPLLSYLAD